MRPIEWLVTVALLLRNHTAYALESPDSDPALSVLENGPFILFKILGSCMSDFLDKVAFFR